jgi:hypothetical protein
MTLREGCELSVRGYRLSTILHALFAGHPTFVNFTNQDKQFTPRGTHKEQIDFLCFQLKQEADQPESFARAG